MEIVVQQVIGGLAIGVVYSLIGLGFTMLIRALDLVNLAQGEMVMIGGLVGFTLVASLGLPFPLTFLVVLAVTALVGVVLEFVVFRPMRRGGSPMINLLIVTIGISILLQNVARLAWGSEPLRYPRVFGTRPFVFGEVVVASYVPWVLVFGVAVMVALQLFFARTPTGIAMRASAQDPVAARLMGVSVDRMITYTFAISAALGGAGGVLIAPVFFASFNMGEIGLKAFVAATIGGLGSMPGAMLGGVVLGLVETFSAFWVSSEYRDAIAYGILILVLLFLPSGILGGRAQQD